MKLQPGQRVYVVFHKMNPSVITGLVKGYGLTDALEEAKAGFVAPMIQALDEFGRDLSVLERIVGKMRDDKCYDLRTQSYCNTSLVIS